MSFYELIKQMELCGELCNFLTGFHPGTKLHLNMFGILLTVVTVFLAATH